MCTAELSRSNSARIPATDATGRTLASSVEQLDELFLLVVVGEFNAGKSAFVNALFGGACSRRASRRRRARSSSCGTATARTRHAAGVGRHRAGRAAARPALVDTPGTNAIVREHEGLTTDFVPRADLVLFVTSADRPFTETERAFLETIRDWGKKIVIVVNKVDIFEQRVELDEVLSFVRRRPATSWASHRRVAGQRAPGLEGEAGRRRRSGRRAVSRRSSSTCTIRSTRRARFG